MTTLRGKTAVVLGASSGLGRATVKALAAEGVRVAAVARGAGGLTELGEESRLDLVSRNQRRGASVAEYYSRYAEIAQGEGLRAEPGFVDGVLALAVFRSASSEGPSYFILLEWDGGKISLIRDFRYVPYVAGEADFSKT